MKPVRGAASDTTIGIKPAIAFASERLAKENIQAKLRLIGQALPSIESEKSNLDVPESRRQFNLWAPQESSGRQLFRNSNETLRKNPELLSAVESATAAVKTAKKGPAKGGGRAERVTTARRTANLHKAIRDIAERELIRARTEALTLRNELRNLKATLASTEKEAKAMLSRSEAEIAALRAEVSTLKKSITKIIPMKRT